MKNKKIKLLVSFFVILTTFSLPVFSEEAIVTYIKGKVEMQSLVPSVSSPLGDTLAA